MSESDFRADRYWVAGAGFGPSPNMRAASLRIRDRLVTDDGLRYGAIMTLHAVANATDLLAPHAWQIIYTVDEILDMIDVGAEHAVQLQCPRGHRVATVTLSPQEMPSWWLSFDADENVVSDESWTKALWNSDLTTERFFAEGDPETATRLGVRCRECDYDGRFFDYRIVALAAGAALADLDSVTLPG